MSVGGLYQTDVLVLLGGGDNLHFSFMTHATTYRPTSHVRAAYHV